MAANTSPIFVLTPKRSQVRISVANTNRDGTGTLGTVATAGANGSFWRSILITPEVTIPSGDVVRIFNQVGGAGNNELVCEFAIPVLVPPTSGAGTPPVPPFPTYDLATLGILPRGITLGASDVLKASTDQGKTYSVAVDQGGDY